MNRGYIDIEEDAVIGTKATSIERNDAIIGTEATSI